MNLIQRHDRNTKRCDDGPHRQIIISNGYAHLRRSYSDGLKSFGGQIQLRGERNAGDGTPVEFIVELRFADIVNLSKQVNELVAAFVAEAKQLVDAPKEAKP